MKHHFVQKLGSLVLVVCALVALLLATPNQPDAADVEQIFVIVNSGRSADLKDPSEASLKRIFLKEKTTWKDGTTYYVVGQKGTDEFTIFRKKILEKTEAQLATYWSDRDSKDGTKPPKEVKTSKSVYKYISKKKDAIGYISKASYDSLTEDEKKKIHKVKAVSKK